MRPNRLRTAPAFEKPNGATVNLSMGSLDD
jgi:hypothetical protein